MSGNAENDFPGMGRRRFLGLAGLLGISALMNSGLASAAQDIFQSQIKTTVVLGGLKPGSLEKEFSEVIRQVAESATDFSWLSKGDTILIKPAVNSPNPYPATTNPAGVKAMAELLIEKGAGRVIVSEMSGIQYVKLSKDKLKGSTRELMKASGMLDAALAGGAELVLPEESGWNAFFAEEPTKGSSWKNPIMMPKIIQQADHVILMPRCGRHLLAGSTLGMKAAVGYWRRDTRLEYHRDADTLQEKTAEANTVPSLIEKQRLCLTVADKVLTTFGPDNGHVFSPGTGLVLASDSIVAHDMASLAWLLYCRTLIPNKEKKNMKDPYKIQLAVNTANRIVTYMLGGIGDAIKSEKLVRNDFHGIWDDRVLRRGFQVFGGIPKLDFVEAGHKLPEALKKRLAESTTPV